jgi:hypothetical protein
MLTRTPSERPVAVTGATPPTAASASGSSAPAQPAAAPASAVGWSPPIDGHGLFKSLMLRLPRGVRRSFDHEQLLAIRQAAEEMAWGEHPIDIRLSLPWPGGRYYLLLIGGRDRRGPHRRTAPIRVGNHASMATLVALLLGLVVLTGLAAARLLGA